MMSGVSHGQMQCEISEGNLKDEHLQEWTGVKVLVTSQPPLPQLTLMVNCTQEMCKLV